MSNESGGSGPVLVVDDDETIRGVVRDILVDEGYAVATAEHGADALSFISRTHPELILLDMRMPIMDGWAFARAYRQKRGPHAPIVVITAARDAATWAAEIDASGFLAKPFDLNDLLGVVAQHVGP